MAICHTILYSMAGSRGKWAPLSAVPVSLLTLLLAMSTLNGHTHHRCAEGTARVTDDPLGRERMEESIVEVNEESKTDPDFRQIPPPPLAQAPCDDTHSGHGVLDFFSGTFDENEGIFPACVLAKVNQNGDHYCGDLIRCIDSVVVRISTIAQNLMIENVNNGLNDCAQIICFVCGALFIKIIIQLDMKRLTPPLNDI